MPHPVPRRTIRSVPSEIDKRFTPVDRGKFGFTSTRLDPEFVAQTLAFQEEQRFLDFKEAFLDRQRPWLQQNAPEVLAGLTAATNLAEWNAAGSPVALVTTPESMQSFMELHDASVVARTAQQPPTIGANVPHQRLLPGETGVAGPGGSLGDPLARTQGFRDPRDIGRNLPTNIGTAQPPDPTRRVPIDPSFIPGFVDQGRQAIQPGAVLPPRPGTFNQNPENRPPPATRPNVGAAPTPAVARAGALGPDILGELQRRRRRNIRGTNINQFGGR